VRTRAAFESIENSKAPENIEKNISALYTNAAADLRDLFREEPEGDNAGILCATFIRFLDKQGVLLDLPKKQENDALADLNKLFGSVSQTEKLGIAVKATGKEAAFFASNSTGKRPHIDEIISTPVLSTEDGEFMGTMLLGFKPASFSTVFADARTRSGIWMDGHLYLLSAGGGTRSVLEEEIGRAFGKPGNDEGRLSLLLGSTPHLLIYKLLNPDGNLSPAYQVSLYPLTESLARLRRLRWQIVGAGVLLLLAALVASHFISSRLSRPVETLEVVSAENFAQRERAEAALEMRSDELRVRNADLQAALAELKSTQQQIIQQERLRALGQMASGIAHDFNNALVPILGFCELLQLSPDILADKKKSANYLETIRIAAQDAASVVGRLREFYRANEEHEKFSPVDLSKLVEQAVNLTKPKWKDQAQAAGATVRVVPELSAVPPIAGEEPALRELLTNLIFNAVDAMPDGGTITIRTRRDGGRVVLEVADTGTGMSEEVRRRCLEPFFSTKGERGTGLGLSMVFGIVQRHGGEIDIRSAVGKGTTFVITFPPQAAGEVAANFAAAAPLANRALKVLVVDDEELVRDLLAAALARDGHHVELAEQGVDGLRRFMAGKFDLVVTDKAMPGMSGDQMATAIKQVSPKTPIILLTGFGQFLDKEKIPNVDVLASKPIGIVALREAITAALTAA
jgi:signal transduction histidine kinase